METHITSEIPSDRRDPEVEDEIWKEVPGYEPYEASNRGRVRNSKTNKILNIRIISTGYPTVNLWRDKRDIVMSVHRMVLLAFGGPCPPEFEAAHLDGVKTNNIPENLKWVSHSENEYHKIIHGVWIGGERRLTKEKVMEIKGLLGKIPQRKIAKMFNVCRSTVSDISLGRTWNHLTGIPKQSRLHKNKRGRYRSFGSKNGRAKLDEGKVREIRKLVETISRTKIAKIYGVSRRTVNRIIVGEAWRHVQLPEVDPAGAPELDKPEDRM